MPMHTVRWEIPMSLLLLHNKICLLIMELMKRRGQGLAYQRFNKFGVKGVDQDK
jgi:hypothetical protein